MAVARQLDGRHSAVTRFEQSTERIVQIQHALAEHAVLVLRVADVVEMHVDQFRRELSDPFADRKVAGDEQVSDVEAQSEFVAVRLESRDELQVPVGALEEHAGFGLEGELHVSTSSVDEQLANSVDQALPNRFGTRIGIASRVADDGVRRRARPNRNDVGTEIGGEVDRTPQVLDAPLAIERAVFEQSREVLATRIEHEARAGFDRERKSEVLRDAPDLTDLVELDLAQVELSDVGCDRDSFVAEVGEHLQRVGQSVVREAVRVVAEAEHVFLLSRRGGCFDGLFAASFEARRLAPARSPSNPNTLAEPSMDWKTLTSTFGLIFLAEMGDKTQLAAITIAAKSKAPWSVFVGASTALSLVSLIGVLAGGLITRWIPAEVLQKLAAVAFIAMGVWMLLAKGEKTG